MKQKKLISKLFNLAEEIRKTYQEEYPEGNHLYISIVNNQILINNRYWGEDKKFAINHHYKEGEINEQN